jgi:hypothetical protein
MKTSNPIDPELRTLMSMRYRNDPNRIPSYDVSNIVGKCAEVHSAITFSPQARHLWESENPVHDSGNFVPKPQSQPGLPRLIMGYRFRELLIGLRERD